MIEVDYNDYKRILEENMRLIPENHKLKEEIERLNNIINELEKLLYKIETDTEMDIRYARSKNDDEEVIRLNRDFNMCDMILDKLEELKGVNKK